jgi:hypothetical protein
MRIHIYFEAVFFALLQDPHGVVHKFIVVLATAQRFSSIFSTLICHPRSLVLKCFPCYREPKHVEAPTPQAGEMDVC